MDTMWSLDFNHILYTSMYHTFGTGKANICLAMYQTEPLLPILAIALLGRLLVGCFGMLEGCVWD